MTAAEIYSITPNHFCWRVLPNGNHVKLGNYVKLGNHVTLGDNVMLGNGVTLDRSPLQIIGPRFTLYPFRPGYLGIGCTILSFNDWAERGASIAAENGQAEYLAEYTEYARIIMAWMKIHMPQPTE